MELNAHPSRNTPGVALDESPGHDLIENRAHDPAVDEAFPAFELVGHRQLYFAVTGRKLKLQMETGLVQLAAGKAVMRHDAEIPVGEQRSGGRGILGRALCLGGGLLRHRGSGPYALRS